MSRPHGLARLKQLLPPPKNPRDADGDWARVENGIGSTLPDDYKMFVETYGTGAIGRMPIWIFNPFTPELAGQTEGAKRAYDTLKADDCEFPYPVFPEKDGLLYFGATGNGHYLNWQTRGVPRDWPIVVYDCSDAKWHVLRMPLVEFLVGVLEHRIMIFPDVFFKEPVVFKSYAYTDEKS